VDRVVAFLAHNERFAATACHNLHPFGRTASAFPGQVGEFTDVMETITNQGLGCLLKRNIRFGHRLLPAFERSVEVVIQHLRPHLEQQMRSFLRKSASAASSPSAC